MELDSATTTTKQLSRWVTIGILIGAIVLGLAVLDHINHSPEPTMPKYSPTLSGSLRKSRVPLSA